LHVAVRVIATVTATMCIMKRMRRAYHTTVRFPPKADISLSYSRAVVPFSWA